MQGTSEPCDCNSGLFDLIHCNGTGILFAPLAGAVETTWSDAAERCQLRDANSIHAQRKSGWY
jgi:hypothetical protein